MSVSQDAIRKSYDQLFGTHYPDILYVQRDRPHNYNLFLKIVALLILFVVTPIISLIPIYPVLYILLVYGFNGSDAFSSGVGKMNILWIVILYVYYITSFTSSRRTEDILGSFGFVGLFMALTPIMLYMSWYYATPVSIHDSIAGAYNSLMGKHPFVRGGVAFTTMKCPTDTNIRIEGCMSAGEQVGKGLDLPLFGIGFSWVMIFALLSLVLIGLFGLLWTSSLSRQSKLKQQNKYKLKLHKHSNA